MKDDLLGRFFKSIQTAAKEWFHLLEASLILAALGIAATKTTSGFFSCVLIAICVISFLLLFLCVFARVNEPLFRFFEFLLQPPVKVSPLGGTALFMILSVLFSLVVSVLVTMAFFVALTSVLAQK